MCFATSGCVCLRSSMRFLNLWLRIALEWLRQGCMGYLVGRKPEHETLCFSVESGCSRRCKVPRVCGGCGWRRFMRELVPPLCSATGGCVCLCSSMRFLNLWLRIALEWLRQGCMGYLVGRKPEHETFHLVVPLGLNDSFGIYMHERLLYGRCTIHRIGHER